MRIKYINPKKPRQVLIASLPTKLVANAIVALKRHHIIVSVK